MKTKFVLPIFGVVMLTALALNLTGCNDREAAPSEPVVQDSYTDEESALIADLAAFNRTLLNDVTRTQQASPAFKKLWRVLVRVCKVASADIIGAAAGSATGLATGLIVSGGNVVAGGVLAVVGGATTSISCSVKAYEKDLDRHGRIKDMALDGNSIYTDPYYVYQHFASVTEDEIRQYAASCNVNVDFLSENPEYNRMGVIHNIALEKLFQSAAETPQTRVIGGNTDNSLESQLLHHKDFVKDYKEQISYAEYYLSQFDEVFTDEGSINPKLNIYRLSPAAKEIMDMFMQLYTRYPTQLEDVDFIVNYYANAIANSKALDPDQKEAMLSALSVSAYSPRYWISQLDLEE